VKAYTHLESAYQTRLQPLVVELLQKSGCCKYGLTIEKFSSVLFAIAEKYLPAGSSEVEVRRLFSSLRVDELALARACADGDERAWEDFFTRYREKLHSAALSITKDDSRARELAGSIYADLYGNVGREGNRVSKLNYYDGRGSLEGWLRIVLAQHHVNNFRQVRHNVSLEEETHEGTQFAAPKAPEGREVDSRLNLSVDEALAALGAEDRAILAFYFIDDLTLARIAAILKVHESTISRRLEKLVKSLRKNILSRLVQAGMSRRQAEEALEVDVRDLTVDIRRRLAQDSAGTAFSKEKVIQAGEGKDY